MKEIDGGNKLGELISGKGGGADEVVDLAAHRVQLRSRGID